MKKEMVGADALAGWQNFYQDFFGQEYDFSKVRIPERKPGFDRLLVIAQGLTSNQIFEACQRRFACLHYTDDLDAATQGRNEREPTQHYAIWVRDRVEADEELKNLSADDIRKRGLRTETLLERLVHEAVFFVRTGKHLDIDNITLCSGSRDQGGDVPRAYWVGGRFGVFWCSPGLSDGNLRAREVVSF